MGIYGKIWGDRGRYEEIGGDMGRYGEIWGDRGRYVFLLGAVSVAPLLCERPAELLVRRQVD